MDIVFVIDSSGSIRDLNPTDGSYDNWELTLKFVADIINSFTIGPNVVQPRSRDAFDFQVHGKNER